MRPSPARTAFVIAGLALSGAACGSGDDDPKTAASSVESTTSSSAAPTTSSGPVATGPSSVTMAGQTVETAKLLVIFKGLCTAAEEGEADVEAAKRTFNSRSHDGLHLIARGLETVDRAAAAALLEAKQKVEGDFSRGAPAAQIVPDLRRLAEVTSVSLARFNVTVGPACPPY